MLKKLVLLAVLLLLSMPAIAQEEVVEEVTHVSYGNLNFVLSPQLPQNLNVFNFLGDPLEVAYPGGPQPKHLEVMLYNESPAPQYPWEAPVSILLYRNSDITGYTLHEQQYQALQSTLSNRADLSQMEVMDSTTTISLPALPVANAVQVIRARSTYVDLCGISGVSYISYYSQAVTPFLGNQFFYTFQGLSADGQYYVSVTFRVNATMFPSEVAADFNYDALAADYTNYGNQSIAALNAAAPEDFTPSLTELDNFIQGISLGEVACG